VRTLQHNCEAKETGQLCHAMGPRVCFASRTVRRAIGISIAASMPGRGDGRVRDYSWPPTAIHRQRPHELLARQLIRSLDAGAAILPSSCRLHAIPCAVGHSARRYHYRVWV